MSTAPKIRVAIVGAGIAGLSAALALQRYPQYSISIYERRPADHHESSAGFGIREHGLAVLKKLGVSREEMRGVKATGYRTYDIHGEEKSTALVKRGADGECALWLLVRQDLREALLQRLTSVDGQRGSVQLFFDSNVTSVEPESGTIHFANNTSVTVDLVIGADGIHSRVRPAVLPAFHPAPVPSGTSLYRFDVPMKVVQDAVSGNTQAQAIFMESNGEAFCSVLAAGNGDRRHVVMYPCRGFEQANFACAIPDSFLDDATNPKYSWTAEGNVSDLIKACEGFPEWITRLLSYVSNVGLFQVCDLEPLSTYVKGRTVLIGDAAHAMVPYQGQGANQALEDVDGLDELFGPIPDVGKIPELLQMWDSVRRPRVTAIQRLSRESLGKVSLRGASDSILSVEPHVPIRQVLEQRKKEATSAPVI